MAHTVNSTIISGGQPSAPFRCMELDVDLDASYPATAGGYEIAELDDYVVVQGLQVVVSDGTTPLYAKVAADGTLHFYVDDTMVEVANGANLAAYTGIKVPVLVQ